MNDESSITAAIIGAGPIGLETAALLAGAGVEYVHFEKEQVGATISRFPPMTQFFSSTDRIALAGVPIPMVDRSKCTREEYLAYLRSFVRLHGLRVRLGEEVVDVRRAGERGFELDTVKGSRTATWRCMNVIFAHGDMARYHRIGIPGEDLPHVQHTLGDVHGYFDRNVLVVGGRNSAVEAALRCYHAGARVALSYRQHRFEPGHVKYWLLPELEGRMSRGEIAVHYETVPTRITEDAVELRHVDTGDTVLLKADAVLLMTGFEADHTLLERLGVHFTGEERTPATDVRTMETNVPGVYVAGTATAGQQGSYRVFIENCHIHAQRITAALTGAPPPESDTEYGYLRES